MERVVRRRIVNHLEYHELLDVDQHGSRQNKSCLSQLLEHHEDILKMYSLNAGNQTTDDPKDKIFWEFSHVYIDRCYLLDSMKWFYLIFIFIFGMATITWSFFTFYIWKGAN